MELRPLSCCQSAFHHGRSGAGNPRFGHRSCRVTWACIAADAQGGWRCNRRVESQKEPLRLFENQTKSHRGGSFRIASCIESEDSIVSLAMAAVSFQADSDVTNVLFWEWQDTSVQTWKGEDSLLLNTALYARHRDMIQQRLDDNARRAIAEFEI